MIFYVLDKDFLKNQYIVTASMIMEGKKYLASAFPFLKNSYKIRNGGIGMEYKDIIDFIFIQKEDENLFNFDDEELTSLDNKTMECDKAITNFINSKIHPKYRKKLKRLILEYSSAMCLHLRQQNELFYRNGFSDGVELIIKALTKK